MASNKTRNVRQHIPERNALTNALHRCHNPEHIAFRHYGERGIAVCDEWRDYKNGFDAFFAHVGPRPSELHSLDRIDNDKNYEPGNVRWADKKTQQNNRRKYHTTDCQDFGWGIGRTTPKGVGRGHGARKSPLIPFKGETKTLAEWAELLGVASFNIRQRLNRGWTPEQALTRSTNKNGQRKTSPVGVYLNKPNGPTIH